MQDPIWGDTPLHMACSKCCEDSIVTLARHGAKFNIENLRGKTPLYCLLEFAQSRNSFHSKTRIKLGKKLYKLGFRVLFDQKGQTTNRNKLGDIYSRVISNETPTLLHICRLKITDSLNDGHFDKSIGSLQIPRQLEHFMKFAGDDLLQCES